MAGLSQLLSDKKLAMKYADGELVTLGFKNYEARRLFWLQPAFNNCLANIDVWII
jgi:hypothetical protein